MLRILLLLFLFVPLIEVYLFIRVGDLIGAFPTVLLCILTAVLGTLLFRLQGLQTLRRVQQKLRQGEMPAIDLIEGVMLLMAGILLLVPGFFTDIIGILCLLPAVRTRIATALIGNPHLLQSAGRRVVIIEGEFHD